MVFCDMRVGFMSNFYREMKGFSSFASLTEGSLYTQVPEDWWVVVTDVRGSTKAIEEGRYKDVNSIGVASIVSISNVLAEELFPFVFGGDGATAIIPPLYKEAVAQSLSSLRELAFQQFQLTLRVGMISMRELVDQGGLVEVAKYELSGQVPLAFFRGGGLQLADTLIKAQQETYEVPVHPYKELNLDTLSCRWNPIPSSKGQVLSLLVQARNPSSDKIYSQFVLELEEVLGSFEEAHPVQRAQMSYRRKQEMWKDDNRFQQGLWMRLYRKAKTFFASLLFLPQVSALLSFVEKYQEAIPKHSDYQKFDDVLRMILDCNPEQINGIQDLCAKWHEQGEIFYGIHLSDSALLTCVFSGFSDGKHVHFVDGGNGGYAMAAKQLKQQLAAIKK